MGQTATVFKHTHTHLATLLYSHFTLCPTYLIRAPKNSPYRFPPVNASDTQMPTDFPAPLRCQVTALHGGFPNWVVQTAAPLPTEQLVSTAMPFSNDRVNRGWRALSSCCAVRALAKLTKRRIFEKCCVKICLYTTDC